MGKKKIIGLCLAVGLMVGVVGGSLAWFTDNDSVTNSFATQGDPSNSGIDIVEDFDKDTADKMLPGTEATKAVQVENKATYDQYIRVKLTKVWKDKAGKVLDKVWVLNDKVVDSNTAGAKEVTLNTNLIELNFGENLGTKPEQWTDKTKQKDGITGGYYYYNGVVPQNELTSKLLESVTLSKDAGNIYKDLKFDVVVDAEGIQAENGAAQDAWGYTPGATK